MFINLEQWYHDLEKRVSADLKILVIDPLVKALKPYGWDLISYSADLASISGGVELISCWIGDDHIEMEIDMLTDDDGNDLSVIFTKPNGSDHRYYPKDLEELLQDMHVNMERLKKNTFLYSMDGGYELFRRWILWSQNQQDEYDCRVYNLTILSRYKPVIIQLFEDSNCICSYRVKDDTEASIAFWEDKIKDGGVEAVLKHMGDQCSAETS